MTQLRKVSLLALGFGLAIALVPFWLPTGPSAGFDAAGLLQSGRFVVAGSLIFLTGLLTALTPCVYPLIPITVGIFGARKAEKRSKAVLLTSAYVLGMGVVFSALGVIAAMTGRAFGSFLAMPAVAIGLAIFMVALAASMFGAFELSLPTGLTQRFNSVGGAGLAGAFLMGSVSGFLAAPCTGPVLAGLLAYVAKTQNAPLGAGLLFIYAMGIGLPFFLIGVFALRLPKGGEWMEWVKSVLGIALVALAAMYLKDAFGPTRAWVSGAAGELGRVPGAWIAGFIVFVGVMGGAVHLSFKQTQREFAIKGLAVAFVVIGIVIRAGALNAGAVGDLWVRLGLQAAEKRALVWDLRFPQEGSTNFDAVLAKAKADHRPVMIDFGADWCAACKELDREVYVAPQVVSSSACFTNIRVDGTEDDTAVDALYKRFGVQGLPTVVFVSADGRVLDSPRVTGFLEPEKFLAEMHQVRSLTNDTSVCAR